MVEGVEERGAGEDCVGGKGRDGLVAPEPCVVVGLEKGAEGEVLERVVCGGLYDGGEGRDGVPCAREDGELCVDALCILWGVCEGRVYVLGQDVGGDGSSKVVDLECAPDELGGGQDDREHPCHRQQRALGRPPGRSRRGALDCRRQQLFCRRQRRRSPRNKRRRQRPHGKHGVRCSQEVGVAVRHKSLEFGRFAVDVGLHRPQQAPHLAHSVGRERVAAHRHCVEKNGAKTNERGITKETRLRRTTTVTTYGLRLTLTA